MPEKIIDINQVPHSPNRGIMPHKIYNPMDEDFTVNWAGEPYTIKGKSSREFPEFLADHIAGHLAHKIVGIYSENKIKLEQAKLTALGKINPATPTSASGYDRNKIDKIKRAIFDGELVAIQTYNELNGEMNEMMKDSDPIRRVVKEVTRQRKPGKLTKIPEESKTFVCEECGKRFAFDYHLRNHKRLSHNKTDK